MIHDENINNDNKTFAMFCHLSALVVFILPLANLILPISMWLAKRKESNFIDNNGKNSINFQLTSIIIFLILSALVKILIGIPLIIVFTIYYIFEIILAAVKANKGELYYYKCAIRFIK